VAVPIDRWYSKEHEWAIDEGDGTIRIGITEFAEHELGDVIYVELPKIGTAVKQNAQMGEIESVKAVSDLFSPVTGEIVEINSSVKDKPELVNEAPYEAGWLVKVKAADTGELAGLLDSAQYEELIS
jgi:glycine cleavage system H protein